MAKTFYDIFEVDTSATPDEIRIAYKRMVQRHHPDKNRGHASSQEMLKAINYAYSVLSDGRKRASYDAKLASSANGTDGGVVPNGANSTEYPGEATVNGAASTFSSTSAAREAAPEAFIARPVETSSSGWSQISNINSWLAFGMLALLFFAVSRFFYQVANYGILSTAEPGSVTLFYGIMIGAIIAGGAVWLAGKMVANTLPLAWPMNLIFRSKVRSDLNPEHRRIASVVLVMGILLTFAVPNPDPNGDQQDALAVLPTATAPVFEEATETPVTAQNPRKNAIILPEPAPFSSLGLAEKVPSIQPADAVKPQDIPTAVGVLPVTKKPNVMVAELPPTPIKATPPSSRAVVETKVGNTPLPDPASAKARVKSIEQEKLTAKKTPQVTVLPAKKAVTVSAVTPPPRIEKKTVLSAPLPEPPTVPAKASPVKSAPEKKEIAALQNNTGVAAEGDPTLATHRKRAQQGAANAQYQLGRAYEKGDSVARNYQQAETWYRKAADQGYGPAQHSLGSMYMLGKGVTMNPVSAYVWLSLAANNNVTSGQQAIDYLVDTLTPAQLADAKRRVAKWSPQRKR